MTFNLVKGFIVVYIGIGLNIGCLYGRKREIACSVWAYRTSNSPALMN